MAKIKKFYIRTFDFEVSIRSNTLHNRIRLLFRILPLCIKITKFYPCMSLEDAIDFKLKPVYLITICKLKFKKEDET